MRIRSDQTRHVLEDLWGELPQRDDAIDAGVRAYQVSKTGAASVINHDVVGYRRAQRGGIVRVPRSGVCERASRHLVGFERRRGAGMQLVGRGAQIIAIE